jgi:hypothetical protein
MVECNQAAAFMGCSVAGAGDVNGDEYSDVIVGAYCYTNDQASEGRAFVFHGSASGLSTTPDWTAESDQENPGFAYSVSCAGDVNGDGYSDVIVGADAFDNGEENEGRAYVYHGGPAGLSTSPDWVAECNQIDAYFGCSVTGAGDVNNDGYDDVIVGAYGYDIGGATDAGRAYVYHGASSGLSSSPVTILICTNGGARFGLSVAGAGDVDDDGYDDVVVGAPRFDNGEADEGAAYMYRGSPAGVYSHHSWTAEADQVGAHFGTSVAGAGDVNNDGYADVIVGAHFFDNGQSEEGRAYVYHGNALGLSATADWFAESDQADAMFGVAVDDAGDLNQDGYSDVIVGAYWYSGGQAYEGRAYAYYGGEDGVSTTADWIEESDIAGAHFANSVAGAGDVNDDGYSDVIIGAFAYSNGEQYEGAAFVYHGEPETVPLSGSAAAALLVGLAVLGGACLAGRRWPLWHQMK